VKLPVIPLATIAELGVIPVRAKAVMVRVAVRLVLPVRAEMTTVPGCAAAETLIVKVPEVWSAASTTFAGTDTIEGLELNRSTVIPPVGAGPFNVTVFAALVAPGPVEAGDSVT
jgi:hypothetical protein